MSGLPSLTEVMKRTEENMEQTAFPDKETMRQAAQDSSPYAFVAMPTDRPTYWIENCVDCRRPMAKVFVTTQKEIRGVVESVQGLTEEQKEKAVGYLNFVKNPVVGSGAEFWFCFGCSSIWTITAGFWTKVVVEGLLKFDEASIPRLAATNPVAAVSFTPDPPPLDESAKPSPDATPCPKCKIWRVILPYSDTHVQHACLKCLAVDLYRIPEQAVQL